MRLITNICEFYHKQGFSPKTFFRRKTLNLIIRHLNLLFSNDPNSCHLTLSYSILCMPLMPKLILILFAL